MVASTAPQLLWPSTMIERDAEHRGAVFEAGEPILVDEISRHAHHEQIAGALIEGEFGRKARKSAQLTMLANGYCASPAPRVRPE